MGYVGPELEVIDFKFFELCFMLFPEFCAKLEPETPYELAPLQEEKTVTDGMRESVIVKRVYPAGRCPTSEERF